MLGTILIDGLGRSVDHPALLAYLDPGSGSMLLQVLIAGSLSSLFLLRSSLARMRDWLSGGRVGR